MPQCFMRRFRPAPPLDRGGEGRRSRPDAPLSGSEPPRRRREEDGDAAAAGSGDAERWWLWKLNAAADLEAVNDEDGFKEMHRKTGGSQLRSRDEARFVAGEEGEASEATLQKRRIGMCLFVPACCVYGSSWKDWQRILALSKLSGALDYMVSLPAHGAVIGAWFGAWPMPLDWERPWQEWPICVTYGATFGYVLGLLASLVFILWKKAHEKAD